MRGQITFDALLAMGAVIIVLISLVNLNWERYYLAREIGEAGEARMMGEQMARAINVVYANGEGFSLYLDSEALDFEELKNISIPGVGLVLPLAIDISQGTINVSKNMSKTGGDTWTASISIIPINISRMDPTSQYPQTSIRNNGSFVVIYSNRNYIGIYRNGTRVD